MTYENIIAEIVDGRVGVIRFNRPKALNALSPELMAELGDALVEFDADPNIGCILITGNERAFAAGADIKAMAQASAMDMVATDLISRWETIHSISKPIVAAVSGFCLGGGCELAMSCDIIVASESAQFGQPEINLGIIPGFGGTQRLTHAVGKSAAMEMVLTGRTLSAEEARSYGLVNHVYPVEVYFAEAVKLAAKIAAQAPIAARLAKEAVNKSFEMSLHEGLNYERRLFHMLFASEDQKEGMAAFIEKRKPNWTGK
ncbi:MAG: enoyl-CoA hydratase/isomerase family protein [Caldilineales bacterium]|nr:enoyl-CoA hydratase/isomerase family protein [Caldilineales bacterium]